MRSRWACTLWRSEGVEARIGGKEALTPAVLLHPHAAGGAAQKSFQAVLLAAKPVPEHHRRQRRGGTRQGGAVHLGIGPQGARQAVGGAVEPLAGDRHELIERLGRARATARSSVRRCSRARAQHPKARRARPSTRAINSLRTGTAISAAAVGVGARRSEAKSIRVMSVSWPTAEISGIMLSAAARTTISSLKAHRSSMEPPPRRR